MSTYRLDNLLSPRSVALVGASPRQVSVGRNILENIRKAQFKGELGLVNPRYAEISGIPAPTSLDKLSFVPELVVITAPAQYVPGIINQDGQRGSAGPLIITAGLGHGPGSLEQAAIAAARRWGMRLAGPNCLGIMMPGVNLNASFSAHMPGAGALLWFHNRARSPLVWWIGPLSAASASQESSRSATSSMSMWQTSSTFRAGQQDARYPALHRGHQERAQVHVGGACRRTG